VEIVHTGFATAVRKLGTIGCKIQIVLPDTTLPDVFNLVKVEAPEPVTPEPVAEAPEPAAGVEAPSGMPAGVTETPGAVGAEGSTEAKDSTGIMPAPVETKGLRTEEPTETKIPQAAGKKAETRNVDGFWEHRHDGLDWHVMAVVHKPEETGEPEEEVRVVGGVTEHKHGRLASEIASA
jgi:small subunit ribosomal protein S3